MPPATHPCPHPYVPRPVLALTVTHGQIKRIAPGPYTLAITVTNTFNVTSRANHTFTKADSAASELPPSFTLMRAGATFVPSQSLTITARWAQGLVMTTSGVYTYGCRVSGTCVQGLDSQALNPAPCGARIQPQGSGLTTS